MLPETSEGNLRPLPRMREENGALIVILQSCLSHREILNPLSCSQRRPCRAPPPSTQMLGNVAIPKHFRVTVPEFTPAQEAVFILPLGRQMVPSGAPNKSHSQKPWAPIPKLARL